jgi:hypothetical protein
MPSKIDKILQISGKFKGLNDNLEASLSYPNACYKHFYPIIELMVQILCRYKLFSDGLLQSSVKLTVLLLPFILGSRIAAQEEDKGIDTLYGFDPLLYNGPYYTYKIPVDAKGSPFFWDGFEKGSIAIMDKTYHDLDLNFDAYNQVLLLKYVNHEGVANIIEVSGSWLGKFSVGTAEFELVQRTEGRPALCQLIASDSVKVRYFWKKELKLDNVFGTPVYVFSRPIREQFLLVNHKNLYYKSNKEFIKAFDLSIQMNISNYIKNNKIKVAKASDAVMTELVGYCNNQINP